MYSSASCSRLRRSSSRAEHFQPDRHVEHGHRLVRQQHLGLGRQRAGERDPLPLPAGQLVRVLADEVVGRGEPHLGEQAGDLRPHLRRRGLALVQPDRALQVIAHGVHRVERGERVLEDDLDRALVAAEGLRGSGRLTGSPSRLIEPEVSRSCPASSRATVDLPEPLSPTSATTAPRYRSMETSRTACSTWPRPSRKSLFSPVAASASGPRSAAADSISPPVAICSSRPSSSSRPGSPSAVLVPAGTVCAACPGEAAVPLLGGAASASRTSAGMPGPACRAGRTGTRSRAPVGRRR